MERIIKGRGCGKTYDLIMRSAETQTPILTVYDKRYIREAAERMGVTIPEPVTVKDIRHRGVTLAAVLVDDAEYVLATMIKAECGAEVDAIALTPHPA